MNIKHVQKIVFGVAVAVFMLTSLPTAHAQTRTVAELQAQIQMLIMQINQLQAQLTLQDGSTGTATCFLNLNRELRRGMTGIDVLALQRFLNQDRATRLAASGAGSPGFETMYFGPLTEHAVTRFQYKYSSDVLIPRGLFSATGVVDLPTRTKMHQLCADIAAGNGAPSENGSSKHILQGEGTLERFSVRSGDESSLEEDQEDASIMEVRFRADDGDVQLNRIELVFIPDDANDEDDPWDTFQEVSIWDGNKRIGHTDTSDRSDWREDRPKDGQSSLRISNIDFIAEEDDAVALTVKVSTQSSIRGAEDGETWSIAIPDDGIRGFDADNRGVYAGDSADAVTIDIDEAGSEDELIIRRSDDDPDASALELKDDTRSGFIEIFAFDIDTDDSAHDIEIREIPVEITVSNETLETFVHDVRLVINGDTYTDVSINDGKTGIVTFDFDRNEFVIDGGDRITATVEVNFKALAHEHEGTTIESSVSAADIDARGSSSLHGSQLSGFARSEMHTLNTQGITVDTRTATVEVTSVTGNSNDYANFTLEMTISAFGQDIYIPTNVDTAIEYQLEDGSGNPISDTGVAVLSSNAREYGSYFRLPEGDTKTFTLDVLYQPGVPLTTARLQLLSIEFNDTADPPTQTWTAVPESNYRTPIRTIVN